MKLYSLKSILLCFAKPNGTKRVIFNLGAIGGISSKTVLILFSLMPFVLFAILFNSTIFEKIGIATAVIAFIISLSIIMIIIFIVIVKIKKIGIKKIKPSWNEYFNDVDLDMVLSIGITPYNKFFEYYSKIDKDNISEEDLHIKLLEAIKIMQEDNKELLDAINKNSHS